MPWVNVGELLSRLRRSGVEPGEVTVYIEDDMVENGTRQPAPSRHDPGTNWETDEPLVDEYDDEED